MREILFRGKRADNGEWVEGGILQTENWTSIFVCKDYQGSLNEAPYSDVEEFDVIPETVGQYTGFNDVEGVRIFGGDIVKDIESGYHYIVKWFDEYGCYALANKAGHMEYGVDEFEMLVNDLIVIDNIHDNSEFTEVSE